MRIRGPPASILKIMRAILFLLVCGTAGAQTQWSGLLVDAGCRDRSLLNLLSPPTQEVAPAQPAVTKVPGITVSPQVVKAERGDVLLPHTLDHASRYSSASCAITADTTSFALLVLPKGPVLNLNQAGNTFAMESFQATPAGREILEGKTGGLKPHAVVWGLRDKDELKAGSVSLISQAGPRQ